MKLEHEREELLAKRVERAKEIDAGVDPDFLPETKHIRDDPSWTVAPAPAGFRPPAPAGFKPELA